MTYLTVRRLRGPKWNPAVPMREQALWAEHAAFMNALAAEGFIVLGGPVGAGDPWTEAALLEIGRIEPWTILLDARARQPA